MEGQEEHPDKDETTEVRERKFGRNGSDFNGKNPNQIWQIIAGKN